ncbi:hypothetical protein [Lutimonas sp.]|uniref:hypothetical protein n=1 Tax=Lutimonas sp. TaxID=1872403 RepID=UPI003D9AEE45
MYTEIKSYRVFLDSGTQKNRSFTTINLFDKDDEMIGSIQFFEDEFEELQPLDMDHIYILYPISKFPFIVDILRNEKPLFLGHWENKYGKYGRICTGKEPVGEGEVPIPSFVKKSLKV